MGVTQATRMGYDHMARGSSRTWPIPRKNPVAASAIPAAAIPSTDETAPRTKMTAPVADAQMPMRPGNRNRFFIGSAIGKSDTSPEWATSTRGSLFRSFWTWMNAAASGLSRPPFSSCSSSQPQASSFVAEFSYARRSRSARVVLDGRKVDGNEGARHAAHCGDSGTQSRTAAAEGQKPEIGRIDSLRCKRHVRRPPPKG